MYWGVREPQMLETQLQNARATIRDRMFLVAGVEATMRPWNFQKVEPRKSILFKVRACFSIPFLQGAFESHLDMKHVSSYVVLTLTLINFTD